MTHVDLVVDLVETASKPSRVEVLMNASAGRLHREGQDKLRAEIEAAFAEHSIAARLTFLQGSELQAGAERALIRTKAGELDAIIVSGGDGTVRSVAAALADTAVPLGVIPLGTLNHFAKDLSIPVSIEEAVATIASGRTRRVDVGDVNGRIFINNSSIGIYPYLVVDRERQMRRHGWSKWPAMVLAGIKALRNLPLRRLSVAAEGREELHRTPCLFIGNNEYHVSGLLFGSRDRLDAGQLCVFVAKKQGSVALIRLLVRCIFRLVDSGRDLRIIKSSAIDVGSRSRKMLVALDGEVELIEMPLRYRIKPRALHVFAPVAGQ